jgi:hypothetical protein
MRWVALLADLGKPFASIVEAGPISFSATGPLRKLGKEAGRGRLSLLSRRNLRVRTRAWRRAKRLLAKARRAFSYRKRRSYCNDCSYCLSNRQRASVLVNERAKEELSQRDLPEPAFSRCEGCLCLLENDFEPDELCWWCWYGEVVKNDNR